MQRVKSQKMHILEIVWEKLILNPSFVLAIPLPTLWFTLWAYPYKQSEINHSPWIETTAINAEQKHWFI